MLYLCFIVRVRVRVRHESHRQARRDKLSLFVPAGILLAQLALTFGMTALFVLSDPIQNYIARNTWTYVAAM